MRTNELLSNTANNATMSSREIAIVTGKRHDQELEVAA